MKARHTEKVWTLWSKTRDFIILTTNNSDNYDEKNIKIILTSDNGLPLKKLEFRNIMIVVRSVFHEGNEYYPQVFFDECLYKLAN